MILPAPKGAFVEIPGVIYPDFVPYVAVKPIVENDRGWELINMYALKYYDDGFLEPDTKHSVLTELRGSFLQVSYEENEKLKDYDASYLIMDLYLKFHSHGTHFTLSAIEWFKKKFKEYNITKKDFNVFE